MSKKMDGARLALISSRFESVASKMTNTLLRTGRSGVLNRARDFSCCIVTSGSELLAAAESLPIHVLAGPDMMSQVMHDFHPVLKKGDAYLNNSPYHGCSHAADHTLMVPVIDDKGVHHFTVLAKAHQADIGNSVPTTYHGAAKDVYEEGALIFPSVKVQENYQDVQDFVRMCEMRIRVPQQWRGDFLAMVGAARIGEREILAMADELGWDALHDFEQQWFDYSETRMAAAISKVKSGHAIATSTHDPFPGTPEDGVTIKVDINVDSEAGRVSVDLRDNPDCLPCGLNLSEACSRTAALVGVFNSVEPGVPLNAGSFRRVNIQLRENCIAGIPVHPTSCSVSTTNIADRVANSVQRAIAKIDPNAGMAEVGAVIPPSTGVVSGKDPETGEAYVNQLFLGFTGGAANSVSDCWLTMGHVGNAGGCHQDSIELDELYHPIVVKERRLLTDSEGAGKNIGAQSLRVEFGPLAGEFEIGYVSDGGINGPKGVNGGLAGGKASQYRRNTDGSQEALPSCSQEVIKSGETIISVSCGGGGFGDPKEREPQSVVEDVRSGLVSATRARGVYAVAVDHDGQLDLEETNLLRSN